MPKSLAPRTIPRNHLANSIQKKQGEIDSLCLPNGARIELGRSSVQHDPSLSLTYVTRQDRKGQSDANIYADHRWKNNNYELVQAQERKNKRAKKHQWLG